MVSAWKGIDAGHYSSQFLRSWSCHFTALFRLINAMSRLNENQFDPGLLAWLDNLPGGGTSPREEDLRHEAAGNGQRANLAGLALARIEMEAGALETARERLAQIRAAARPSSKGTSSPQQEAALFARLFLLCAELARRRGALLDASAYLDLAAPPCIRAHAPVLPARLAHHRAVVAAERGATLAAERLLAGGLPLAEEAGISRRFHRTLGGLAARRGSTASAAHHLRMALDQCASGSDTGLAASLQANLAMVAWMRGDREEAIDRASTALAMREGSPPAPRANTLALYGIVSGEETFMEAISLAEQAGDPTLLGEVLLHAAARDLEVGRLGLAKERTARGALLASRVKRREPTPAALAEELRGRLALASQDLEAARSHFLRALEDFDAIGATFHLARVTLRLAALDAELGHPLSADAMAGRAAAAALRAGFALPAEATLQACLRAAAQRGQPAARRYAEGQGIPLPTTGTGAVHVDRKLGLLQIGEARWQLGRRSILLRLAIVLISAGEDGIDARRICRRLWRSEGYSAKTYRRLKVHICRLRELVGRDSILTLPGQPAVHYRWSPERPARVT